MRKHILSGFQRTQEDDRIRRLNRKCDSTVEVSVLSDRISTFIQNYATDLGVGVVEVELGCTQGIHDSIEDTDCEREQSERV
jgi:hypothetical protein